MNFDKIETLQPWFVFVFKIFSGKGRKDMQEIEISLLIFKLLAK